MKFPIKFSPNLVLHKIESMVVTRSGSIDQARFLFTFFGQEAMAFPTKKKVQKDQRIVEVSCDAELFASFEEQIQFMHWYRIKELYLQFEKEQPLEAKA